MIPTQLWSAAVTFNFLFPTAATRVWINPSSKVVFSNSVNTYEMNELGTPGSALTWTLHTVIRHSASSPAGLILPYDESPRAELPFRPVLSSHLALVPPAGHPRVTKESFREYEPSDGDYAPCLTSLWLTDSGLLCGLFTTQLGSPAHPLLKI